MVVVKSRVDGNGRVYIPSGVRAQLDLDENSLVDIEVKDARILITKGESVAEEAKGIFRTDREVTDVDRALKVVSRKKVKRWTT